MLQKKERQQLANAINQSQEEMRKTQEIGRCGSLKDIIQKINLKYPWKIIESEECSEITIFLLKKSEQLGPQIRAAIVIQNDFSLSVYINSVKVTKIANNELPFKVNQISEIEQICEEVWSLTNVSIDEHATTHELDDVCILYVKFIISILIQFKTEKCSFCSIVEFVCEQLQLLTTKKRKYSSDFLIFSSIFFNLSPHAYRFLRSCGKIILPCYTTIRKLTLNSTMDPFHEHNQYTFLLYIKQKIKALTESDKTVSLLVDEIHLKPYFDYKGGNIAGAALHSKEAANSAFVFMITSLFSSYKDVVYILPSNKMTSDILHGFISKTVTGLESTGFRVISVITDNNSINSKAMSFFASPPQKSIVYPHPSYNSRPLFFILDAVHILKCIRNNWLNQKSLGRCIVYPAVNFCNINTANPDGLAHASFEALKHLHRLESHKNLTFSYKLSVKALNPSNLERQNVRLVLQIFNEYVSQALLELGDKFNISHYHDTSIFIKLIYTWWEVVNVKTPQKGRRLNNKYQQPLVSIDNEAKKFLQEFSNWLLKWSEVKNVCGKLTRETFGALMHTTHALLEITEYCLHELGAKYVLLGKFQTDSLESRFGQYRQLAGGKYDVSLRQVYECEKKLRLLSVLKLKLNNVDINLTDFAVNWDLYDAATSSKNITIPVVITEEDIIAASDSIPVITYIGGYCCYSINKKLNCEECRLRITSNNGDEDSFNNSLIKGINRGSLIYPSSDIVNIALISYITVQKITEYDQFLKSHSQRALIVNTIMSVLQDELFLFDFLSPCSLSHEPIEIVKMTVYTCTNILMNNYCFRKNDVLGAAKLAKRRKLQTLVK